MKFKKHLSTLLAGVIILGAMGVTNTANAQSSKLKCREVKSSTYVQYKNAGVYRNAIRLSSGDGFYVTSSDSKYVYGYAIVEGSMGNHKYIPRVNKHQAKQRLAKSKLNMSKYSSMTVNGNFVDEYVTKDSAYYKGAKGTRTYKVDGKDKNGRYLYANGDLVKDGKDSTRKYCKVVFVTPVKVVGSSSKVYIKTMKKGTYYFKSSQLKVAGTRRVPTGLYNF